MTKEKEQPFDLDNCYDQAEADLLNYIYEIEKNKMEIIFNDDETNP